MDIRTEGVQAVLGGSAILKGVDIQVGQRELVGIIGPNGSGKSTLLKCIYRVLKPTGGAVLLDGRDLDQYSYRESAGAIAVVAQHNYYNFEFSVQDVVMMGRAPHKRALDRTTPTISGWWPSAGAGGHVRLRQAVLFHPLRWGAAAGHSGPRPWPSRPLV